MVKGRTTKRPLTRWRTICPTVPLARRKKKLMVMMTTTTTTKSVARLKSTILTTSFATVQLWTRRVHLGRVRSLASARSLASLNCSTCPSLTDVSRLSTRSSRTRNPTLSRRCASAWRRSLASSATLRRFVTPGTAVATTLISFLPTARSTILPPPSTLRLACRSFRQAKPWTSLTATSTHALSPFVSTRSRHAARTWRRRSSPAVSTLTRSPVAGPRSACRCLTRPFRLVPRPNTWLATTFCSLRRPCCRALRWRLVRATASWTCVLPLAPRPRTLRSS
mmetsp:Transcript_11769/g.37342  ORF Transcript_11769/g.37342 Transcript_11769/m.37342 type:complete len:280 (+) Transcript_11769:128-967(+)